MTELSDRAEALTKLGFRVFPLYGIRDGVCTCQDGPECPRPGKHPRFSGWQDNATSVPVAARTIFEAWNYANIGIATGKGLVVVDCDSADAMDFFRTLVSEFVVTYAVQTRKGMHYYFTHDPAIPVKTVTAWYPGIDIRGHAGLVVAAGSTHQSGFRYMANDLPVQSCPERLLTALPRISTRPIRAKHDRVSATVEMPGADSVARALFLDPMESAASGGRNALLFRLACNLLEMVDSGLLFPQRMDELGEAALSAGLTREEIQRTIQSAINRERRT